MSISFRPDQADSLVVTKEERLSLSVNTKTIATVVFSLLCLRSKDRPWFRNHVSALQRANIELSSNLLRSYAAVAWIKEMKCLYSALHSQCLLKSSSQTHSWTPECIACLWSICEQWNRLLCAQLTVRSFPLLHIHFSGLSGLAFT